MNGYCAIWHKCSVTTTCTINLRKGEGPKEAGYEENSTFGFIVSCSSMVMKDVTALTPTNAKAELYFQM